jgi:hypothetical protein
MCEGWVVGVTYCSGSRPGMEMSSLRKLVGPLCGLSVFCFLRSRIGEELVFSEYMMVAKPVAVAEVCEV